MADSQLEDRSREAGGSCLDLHEGIGDPPLVRRGCERWPEGLRLEGRGPDGVRYVEGCCRATNRCSYAARLYAVETSEMWLLDAMEDAPTCWLVLTAREHLTREQCRDHLRQLRRSLRKRWPAIRWAVSIEFQRRGALHLNLLVKGVPVGERFELRRRAVAVWCARVDAEPAGQSVRPVNDGPGLVRYLTDHVLKAAQAPAKGWQGHRTSQTRDYLVRPASVMREEARESLREKRRLWKARHELGPDAAGELVELYVTLLREQERATSWRLVEVGRVGDRGVLEPRGVLEVRRRKGWQHRRGELVQVETGELWASSRRRE
jgi:hypothetical protein